MPVWQSQNHVPSHPLFLAKWHCLQELVALKNRTPDKFKSGKMEEDGIKMIFLKSKEMEESYSRYRLGRQGKWEEKSEGTVMWNMN